MWATYVRGEIESYTPSAPMPVPEMFQRKPELSETRRYALPYVGPLSYERLRGLFPELIARAYIHMQELGWPLGSEQDLWVGTHKERLSRFERSRVVNDYHRVHAIIMHRGALRAAAFSTEMKLYKDGEHGSIVGHSRSTPFVELDPAKLDDSTSAYLFDGLCEILNYPS